MQGLHQKSGDPPELNSLEKQVIDFFGSNGINMKTKNIEGCHPLPTKYSNQTRHYYQIREQKTAESTAYARRKAERKEIYGNEYLINKNADIARQARLLRKQRKKQSTWTENCKLFIRLNWSLEETKVLVITEMMQLEKYN